MKSVNYKQRTYKNSSQYIFWINVKNSQLSNELKNRTPSWKPSDYRCRRWLGWLGWWVGGSTGFVCTIVCEERIGECVPMATRHQRVIFRTPMYRMPGSLFWRGCSGTLYATAGSVKDHGFFILWWFIMLKNLKPKSRGRK